MSAAVEKIPESDSHLRKELTDFRLRLLDLSVEKETHLHGKEDYERKLDMYRRIRDELLGNLKKIAAERNATVELRPVDELEVAHPPDPKWERLNSRKNDAVYYSLRAKNIIVLQDSSQQDLLERPKLEISCPAKEQVNVSLDAWVETGKVRLKFDGAAPVAETWIAGNTRVFPLHSEQLFRRLQKAKTFAVELTPHRKSPQTVIFNLADFKDTVGDDRNCHP
jgi:hypothetical protein